MTRRKQATLPPDAFDVTPTAQLTFTAETLWLTRFDAGAAVATYPVSVADAAAAFRGQAGAALSTGLLPADVLFYAQALGKPARIGLWLPPARRVIAWAYGRKTRTLTVPLPGLVFIGQGAQFWAWAAGARPEKESDGLYCAPLANVSPDGLICLGNVEFPKAAPDTIAAGARAFLESNFNDDLSSGKVKEQGDSLLAFLKSLEGKRAFPLARLRPAGLTMGQAMRGERGRGVAYYRTADDEAEDERYEEPDPEQEEDADALGVWLGDGEELREEVELFQ